MSRGPQKSIRELVALTFHRAILNGVDKIIFGGPPAPYEIGKLPPPPTLAEQVAAGQLTQAQADELQVMEAGAAEDHEEFLKTTRAFGEQRDSCGPFASSCLKNMPVWTRHRDKWCLDDTLLPVEYLPDVIACLIFYSRDGLTVKTFGDEDYLVHYSLGVEKNYCYSVTINEARKIRR